MIKSYCALAEEMEDDDLHEFEDTEITEKQTLDIKTVHIYLHKLSNWDRFDQVYKLQIQYGRLHSNGKFEVKSYTKDQGPSIEDQIL